MAYTAQQQQRIDAANAKVKNAQAAYDSARNAAVGAKNNFCNDGWWSYLTDCDIRNASTKGLTSEGIKVLSYAYALTTLGASVVVPKITSYYTQKSWAKPTSCDDALSKGILLTWECKKSFSGDCRDKGTCDTKVGQYNAKIQAVYSTSESAASAAQALSDAKKELADVIKAIQGEVQNDPQFIHDTQVIAAEAAVATKAQREKWMVFGIIAVLILVIVAFVYLKYIRKAA